MKQENLKISAAVVLGLALAGCSGGLDKLSVRAVQPEGMAVSGGAGDLIAEGRRMLTDGQYGLAISRFRLALQVDDGSAEAHNGLAVAYALLGRPDLARRHFRLAALRDPENDIYRRNLARLDAGNRQGTEMLAASVSSSGEARLPGVVANSPDAAAEKALRIVSLSSGSAMLVTRPGGGMPMASTPSRQAVRIIRPEENRGPVLERTGARMVMLRTADPVEKVAAANQPAGRTVALAIPARAARSITVPIVRRVVSNEACATASGQRVTAAVRIAKCPA